MGDNATPFRGDIGPEGNFSRYLSRIRTYPLLSADEEQRLARLWRFDGDIDAAHTLVRSHLRLAAKLAMGYKGYGLPIEELVSEANIGLMQAVQRFDPERGFRLATYAMWWIRAAIQEYVLHSWSLVRLGTTAQQKKLFFNLRRIKGRLEALEDGDLSAENVKIIADELRVSESEVVNMNRRLGSPDQSLNVPVREGGEGDWQDWLVDGEADQEVRFAEREHSGYQRRLLDRAMKDLTTREREIVIERRLKENPPTLEQLSHRFGISRERVRQIEVGAVEKLSRWVASGTMGKGHVSSGRDRTKYVG